MTDFIHPESGELLATEVEWRQALDDVEDRLGYLYRLRRTLRDGEELKVAELPPRIARTPTQDKVARCPRCGQKERTHELVSAQCYHGKHEDCSMPSPYICDCACHGEQKDGE